MSASFNTRQLLVAPDERRLDAFRPLRTSRAHDAQRAPRTDRLVLPLQRELAELSEGDRMVRREERRLPDEHRPWRRRRLQPRRSVDEVSGDEALGGVSLVDGGFAREHARSRRETGDSDLLAERRDRVDEVEAAAHGPFGVVFVRDGVPQTAKTVSPMKLSITPP